MGLVSVSKLSPGAIEQLMDYDWPGNVREVSNVVERALIQSEGRFITFDDIPSLAFQRVPPVSHITGTDLRLEEIEAKHIRHVMGLTGGRIEGEKGAAEILDINPGTLRHRMRKLNIPFGRKKKRSVTR